MSRPSTVYPKPPPGPHGIPTVWVCYSCERRMGAYAGDAPRGWKRYGDSRAICDRCATGRVRR